MNNLTRLYELVETFSSNHNMVNSFKLVGSEDELANTDFDYRSLIMMPLQANLSRELNNPVYELEFGIIVIDRVNLDDSASYIYSSEENIFVIGQLQDYLLQNDVDVVFENVELNTGSNEDYNITIAMADFSAKLARQPYIRDIDV